MSKIKMLQQQRAHHALSAIREVEALFHGEQRKKFVAVVESLPATIVTSGLGQAAATLLAQASREERNAPLKQLYHILQGWLCSDDPRAPYRGAGDLVHAITEKDRFTYLQAQVEAMAYLEWLKRFAVAFLKE